MTLSALAKGGMDYAKRICYSTEETLNFSYDMAKKYADKSGVYVECGVAAGAQIIAMAAGAPNKTIYAFDSFQGIPLPSCMDDQYPGIRMISDEERRTLPGPGEQVLESSGATVVSLHDFWVHIENSKVNQNNIFAIDGWFENTVKDFSEPIAILRLDGDLYNSTRVCLLHLFPKVVEGGLVIVDDWSLKGCREACHDYFEIINYSPDWQFISNIAYFIK